MVRVDKWKGAQAKEEERELTYHGRKCGGVDL